MKLECGCPSEVICYSECDILIENGKFFNREQAIKTLSKLIQILQDKELSKLQEKRE